MSPSSCGSSGKWIALVLVWRDKDDHAESCTVCALEQALHKEWDRDICCPSVCAYMLGQRALSGRWWGMIGIWTGAGSHWLDGLPREVWPEYEWLPPWLQQLLGTVTAERDWESAEGTKHRSLRESRKEKGRGDWIERERECKQEELVGAWGCESGLPFLALKHCSLSLASRRKLVLRLLSACLVIFLPSFHSWPWPYQTFLSYPFPRR